MLNWHISWEKSDKEGEICVIFSKIFIARLCTLPQLHVYIRWNIVASPSNDLSLQSDSMLHLIVD